MHSGEIQGNLGLCSMLELPCKLKSRSRQHCVRV
jgi:hypothetical protein